MKAALAIIAASLLAFPLALALASQHGAGRCPDGLPCLPRDIRLSAEQEEALRGVYARHRRQQAALQAQARQSVLAVLTPAQRQQLLVREPRFDTVMAPRAPR